MGSLESVWPMRYNGPVLNHPHPVRDIPAPRSRGGNRMKRIIVALGTILVLLIPATAQAGKAQVTYISGQPLHYFAAHRSKSTIDWKRGAVVLLTNGKRSLWVKQMDWCAGSACRDMDLSLQGFQALGGSTTQGIMAVDWACGKKGQLPDSACVR